MLTAIFGVVVLLGGLVFFHELGHYSVAKFFGVRVEVFSLGFGKKILSKVVGETEYCLSIVPLGGYVKLMGDDPYKAVAPEDAHRAFSTQKLYKRFAIVAAGPIANLLLAYVLLTIVYALGMPTPSTKLGAVTIDSPAWQAGLRPRDMIREVSGKAVPNWAELQETLREKNGQQVELKIERGTETLNIPYQVGLVRGRNDFGEEVMAGGIKGISINPIEPIFGVSNPESVAAKAGIKTGDQITKIGARAIAIQDEVNDALSTQWEDGAPLTFSLKRPGADPKAEWTDQTITLTLPKKPAADKVGALGLSEALGLYPMEFFVNAVAKDSAAEKGGLKPGDRLIKVGGTAIYGFDPMVDRIQELGPKDQPIEFLIERDGKQETLALKPVQTTMDDPITRKPVTKYLVGFGPQIALHKADITHIRYRDPMVLIPFAVKQTHELAHKMLLSFGKLLTGKVSTKNLGGPVLIAKEASRSLAVGKEAFLYMMAFISINLFLLNLFPIPVLDGGHLFFFTIEAIKGRPVSIRTMELANQVGMVLILMLVGFTLFNDITREML